MLRPISCSAGCASFASRPTATTGSDNLGRRSPQELTPGLEDLKLGQRAMRDYFELVDFARDEHLTVKMRKWTRIFGDFAVSYVVWPGGDGVCRLLVKFVVRYPRWPHGWLMRLLLPWGDLVMMRRQLLNLKALAEKMAMLVEAESEEVDSQKG